MSEETQWLDEITARLEAVKAEARAGVLADSGLLAQPFPTRAEIAEEPTGLPIGFDRWLEQVKAEAWDEGFADGVNHDVGDWENAPSIIKNPYRHEKEKDDAVR